MIRRHIPALAAALLFSGGAQAADYCWITSGRAYLTEGATVTSTGKVVISSVQRPVYPGHPKGSPWCGNQWRNVAGFASSKVIEPPRLGEARTLRNVIWYKGNQLGHDHFAVAYTWLTPRNEYKTGTIVYEVDVVPTPF